MDKWDKMKEIWQNQERDRIIKILTDYVRDKEQCPICKKPLINATKAVQEYRKKLYTAKKPKRC